MWSTAVRIVLFFRIVLCVCVCATDRFSTTFVIELHPLFILKAFKVLSLRIFNVILVFAAAAASAAPRIENNKNENEL